MIYPALRIPYRCPYCHTPVIVGLGAVTRGVTIRQVYYATYNTYNTSYNTRIIRRIIRVFFVHPTYWPTLQQGHATCTWGRRERGGPGGATHPGRARGARLSGEEALRGLLGGAASLQVHHEVAAHVLPQCQAPLARHLRCRHAASSLTSRRVANRAVR
eukprot:112673-Prorocentrum_minimum.AAC.1